MIEIKGLSELNSKLAELAKKAPGVAEEELSDIALDLAGEASDLAPILNGDLRGDIARPRKIDKGWAVGSDLPYAMTQHEHTEFRHPLGGQAKYLEQPFNSKVDGYLKQIGDRLSDELK